MKVIIQKSLIYPEILWKRPVHFYNKRAGKILILAGSRDKSRNALLITEVVFRSGTGIITLGFPEGLKHIYKGLLPEAISLPLSETPGYTLSKKSENEILDHCDSVDIVLLGPGLSQNAETLALIWELMFRIKKPIILDDDGINAFSLGLELLYKNVGEEGLKKYLSKRKSFTILILDSSNLLKLLKNIRYKIKEGKLTKSYIEKNTNKVIAYLAEFLNMYIIIQNYDVVFAGPNRDILINKTGDRDTSPVDAKADILSGIVGSFVSQNLYSATKRSRDIFEAIATATYLHGKARKMAKQRKKSQTIMSADIIKLLPRAIKEAEEDL